MIFWLLDKDKNPYSANLKEYEKYCISNGAPNNQIKNTELKKYRTRISTIFIPVNFFNKYQKDILFFETMIFNNKKFERYQERYCTYKQACDGHRRAIRAVIKEIRNETRE